MKFALAALFTLALALGAQSSIIPWGAVDIAGHGHGLSYTAVSGPAAVAVHAPAAVAVHAAVAPWGVAGVGPWGGVWGPSGVAGHGAVVVAGHGHGPVVVAGHAHGHEGTYVAKTRGAVHTAPLAGHIASAASINVAPAPGTI